MKLKDRQLVALRARPRLSMPLVEWGQVAAQYDQLRETARRTACAIILAQQPIRGRTQFFVHLDDANFYVLPEV